MKFRCLFFDLDETLYPPSNGLWNAISERMADYMVNRLGVEPDQVHALRRSYFETHGTTLRGLQMHHQVDPLDFLGYVHDIPLHNVLKPDPMLRPLLQSLPQPKWICTNADSNHARRVLQFLGVDDCFEGVVDILESSYTPKPAIHFYQRALELAGECGADQSVFLDDLPNNLAPAREMGFTTVLVRPGTDGHPAASYTVPNIHKLPEVFPELWRDGWKK
jgi:pyrimidine 5'-nucleotidase